MTILSFTPPRSPLTDSRGFVSRDWSLFLAGLYERAGGTSSQTIPQVTADVAALAAVVAALVEGHLIEDEGAALPQRDALNFVGAGVTVTDDAGKTLVTIPGAAGGSGHAIEDEGVSLTQRATLDFAGAGVTVTDTGSKTLVTIPGGGHVIEDEGVPLAQQSAMNFVGAGVTVTDAGGKTVVTIPGGGGGGGGNSYFPGGF